MRFLRTVFAAAVLIFLLYLAIGIVVDGYLGGNMVPDDAVPEAWAAPDSWSEWRDIFLVFAGLAWFLAGVACLALVIALVFLVFTLRKVMQENAAPAIDSLRTTLDNARGTTEFVGETVVSPIIRTYAVFSGIRTGLRAVTGFPSRVRGRKRKGKK